MLEDEGEEEETHSIHPSNLRGMGGRNEIIRKIKRVDRQTQGRRCF